MKRLQQAGPKAVRVSAKTARLLQTKTGRRGLEPNPDMYWSEVKRGCAIGYRRTDINKAGVFWLRRYVGGKYRKRRIGKADDLADSDGRTVYSWDDVLRLATNPAEARAQTAGNGYTVEDACTDYLARLETKSRSASSVQNARYHVDTSIVPKHGDLTLAELTTDDLQAWLYGLVPPKLEPEAKRRAQASAKRIMNTYWAALNYAFRRGKVATDAEWRRVEKFQNTDQPGTRALSESEARAVLKAARPDMRDVLAAYILTGARVSELLMLTVDRVEGTRIQLRASDTKTGKPRYIVLNPHAVALFERLIEGKEPDARVFTLDGGSAITTRVARLRLAEACRKAHVAHATPRDLRRTFGTLLVNRDVPLEVVSALLGHADMRITKLHYAHLADARMREGLTKLPEL